MKTKQVIVWRKDLKVRKGKFGAQIAHASLKIIFDLCEPIDCYHHDKEEKGYAFVVDKALQNWKDGIFTKIVLGCKNEDEILELEKKAKEAGLLNALITDVGKTEFNGIPTITCLAIGPADSDEIDKITGHLSLL